MSANTASLIFLLALVLGFCLAGNSASICASPHCHINYNTEEVSTLEASLLSEESPDDNNWVKEEEVPPGASTSNKNGACYSSCEWFYSMDYASENNTNDGQICLDCTRRFIVYPKQNGTCYTFPQDLEKLGADTLNQIKDRCSLSSKDDGGGCACLEEKINPYNVGVLLKNIRQQGRRAIEKAEAMIAKIIRYRNRRVKSRVIFLNQRRRYRIDIVKNSLTRIYRDFQRKATRAVIRFIKKRQPKIWRMLNNMKLSLQKRQYRRRRFVLQVRAKERKERVMANLDAKYVRIISLAYLKSMNKYIRKKIHVIRLRRDNFIKESTKLLNDFRRIITKQVKRDVKFVKAQAELFNKQLQDIRVDDDDVPMINMTRIEQRYQDHTNEFLSQFSWFDPSKLRLVSFNETNERELLLNITNGVYKQVIETRTERYKTFIKENDPNKLYDEIQKELTKYDRTISSSIQTSEAYVPMPLKRKPVVTYPDVLQLYTSKLKRDRRRR